MSPSLTSEFDPNASTISLALTVGSSGLPAGGRLALTSIVQLTPGADCSARLVARLATYHEFEPVDPTGIEPGTVWTIDALTLDHRPAHANDGPVSAFLILPDESTLIVDVVAMTRLGDADVAVSVTGDVDRVGDGSGGIAALVPFPAHIEIVDRSRSAHTTASLVSGVSLAGEAWKAVAALCERSGRSGLFVESGGLAVTAVAAATVGSSGGEAYTITVGADTVTISAAESAGFRHAFVTLAQWLHSGVPRSAHVEDQPRYRFRGLHIDLARQWFEPDVVERLIDVAAWRKLSHLHLHLTDDEAWRLPVEAFPQLAEVGGRRGHGLAVPPLLGGGAQPVGRAYTRDEIAGWVASADQLGIVLVPEVDLPAHVHAALTAMPELRDPDDQSQATSVQFYTDNVLVPGHPLTTPFVEQVIDTVADLFPSSPSIHIGGDEVPEGAWGRSPIAQRFAAERSIEPSTSAIEAAFHRDLVATIRTRTGRNVGAWQEAAESGGVEPGDGYVVGWRTVEASRVLAAAGYDVVVSPGQAYYLDMASDDEWSSPGMTWAGTATFDDVCEFDPEFGWSPDERSHLLGVQACLWTEHVHDEATMERLLFPRLDAIAERGWSGTIAGGPESLRERAGDLPRVASRTLPA